MKDITVSQLKLLRNVEKHGGILGCDKGEEEPYWDLHHIGYVKVLVSLGSYEWIVKLTDDGEKYLENESETTPKPNQSH